MAAGTIQICDCHWIIGMLDMSGYDAWSRLHSFFLSMTWQPPVWDARQISVKNLPPSRFQTIAARPYMEVLVSICGRQRAKNNWTPPMEVYINVISHVVSQVVGILGKNGCGMVGMVGLLGFDFAAHQQTWNTHLRSRCVVPGAGYVSSLCPLKPDSAQVDREQLNFLLATTHWNWTRHCAINLFVCLFCDVWSVFLGIRIFLICLMFLLSLLVF